MRTVWAVTTAVVVMVAWCLLFLVPLYLVIGPERALSADGSEFSTFWVGLAMVVCLAAAVIGGWLSHSRSGRLSAVAVLATLLLVVGFADAGAHEWLRLHPGLVAGVPGFLRLAVLMPEPSWYDWMLPTAMACFAWVAGHGRAVETAPVSGRRQRARPVPEVVDGSG